MQDRILSFFGMSKTSIIESRQQEKETQKQKWRRQCGIVKEEQQNSSKIINPQIKKRIQVPKQYEDQLFSFKSQRNLYVFPNELLQGYERCSKLLPYCDTVKTSFIFMSHYPQFLSKSIHINFNQLTNLILIQCKIQSIESLSFLDAPSLRNLYLDENRIVCIKPLMKTKFCLSVLSICNESKHAQNNRVRQFDLSRFHMKQNTISATLNLFLHDIFKLESSFIKLFKIQSPLLNIQDGKKTFNGNHFRCPKYDKKLEAKFIGLKFTLYGIRSFSELVESKFEYIYYQKIEKKKRYKPFTSSILIYEFILIQVHLHSIKPTQFDFLQKYYQNNIRMIIKLKPETNGLINQITKLLQQTKRAIIFRKQRCSTKNFSSSAFAPYFLAAFIQFSGSTSLAHNFQTRKRLSISLCNILLMSRIQSFLIFVGMSTIGLFKPWLKNPKTSKMEFPNSAEKYPTSSSIYVFLLPSLLDLAGTVVDTAGLFYTSVSVSQMLKGSVIFFTYMITIFYLNKKLSLKKHILMLVILASLFLIACSNIENKDQRYESQPLLGNMLIVISQLLFSFMFIVEEKLLKNHRVDVIDAVIWEGLWGSLFAGGLLIVFSSVGSQVVKCDFIQSCSLIYENPNLLIAILCTFMAIGPFNYFGMSITKQASALHRCLMCTFRMVVVWIVSLLAGWGRFFFY